MPSTNFGQDDCNQILFFFTKSRFLPPRLVCFKESGIFRNPVSIGKSCRFLERLLPNKSCYENCRLYGIRGDQNALTNNFIWNGKKRFYFAILAEVQRLYVPILDTFLICNTLSFRAISNISYCCTVTHNPRSKANTFYMAYLHDATSTLKLLYTNQHKKTILILNVTFLIERLYKTRLNVLKYQKII